MSTKFEDRYLDVLQNIEAAIVAVSRQRPELLDYDVEATLEALIGRYRAEELGRTPRPVQLTERREELYEAVLGICEWRLGRGSPFGEEGSEGIPGPTPISVEEIVACLKRIQKSVKRWNKQGGRQGYLTFIRQYVQ